MATRRAPARATPGTKDGNKYKITGTATGVDMANPMQPVNKPFEIDVDLPHDFKTRQRAVADPI